MDLGFTSETAVVTGGASGIGLACARELAAEGCRVAVWDVAPEVEMVAADLVREFGGEAVGLRVDVADFDAMRAAARDTELRLGAVDLLVHAAAIGSGKFGFPFLNLAPADWPRVLDVNVMGAVHAAHALAPGMMQRNRGAMVFLSSVAGQIGSQTDPPYSASKAANINFAQCLARDLAPAGIRVNVVSPGMVRSPLNQAVWRAWHAQQPPEQRLSYEEWGARKLRATAPLGRWQQPEDIAKMVVFLLSRCAEQVTGQTINVDGGQVMRG